jgi:hypothetical protein
MAFWEMAIEELRCLASQKGIPPYYIANGARKPLTADDLKLMFSRLALREKGLDWYGYRDLEAGCSPSARQHTFWSNPDASTWDSCTQLPNYAQVGLFSKLSIGYDVVLWTYHPGIEGLPPAAANNLKVADASLLWPRSQARAHVAQRFWRIQHVSDYARFLATARYPSDEGVIGDFFKEKAPRLPIAGGAWFADLDCVEFHFASRLPSKSHHCFNSMAAELSEFFNCTMKNAKVKFLRVPGEPAWLAVPFYFPTGSPVLQRIIERFQGFIGRANLYKDYNCIMRIVRDELQEASLHVDVLGPSVFNGVSPAQQHASMFSGRAALASEYGSVSRLAMGLNQYWSSTKCSFDSKEKPLAPGSFMAKMLQEIGLGDFISAGSLPVSFFSGKVVLRPEIVVLPKVRMRGKGRPKTQHAGAPQWLRPLVMTGAWPPGNNFLDPISWLALAACCKCLLSGNEVLVQPWFQVVTEVVRTCRSPV